MERRLERSVYMERRLLREERIYYMERSTAGTKKVAWSH